MQRNITRRNLILGAGAAISALDLALSAQTVSNFPASKLGLPGLYKGRVIAVEHSGSIVDDKYQRAPVEAMMSRGMKELTGADWADSWRQFVSKDDVVGIKVNPVGQPHVISAPEVLQTIIGGLRAAGVPAKNIVVYDRYRDQFTKAGFDKWLPEGVRWSSAVKDYDNIQLDIEGYDLNHYMDMALTHPGYDVTNERARRSYAAKFITQEVNKLINLCVLKDHQSAGVTLALKNLSHGHVNNVSRSHFTTTANSCGAFIPAVVSMPVIRNKAVLHILDGVKGLYHGGPGAKPQFVWEHKTMYFATDAVALDHVGFRAIDEKRKAVGKESAAEDRPDKFSTFRSRQVEHVEIAGALGLGVWDWDKIDRKHIKLA